MKALKWIGIGVGGLAAFVGVIVGVVFMLTGGAATAADEFLALIARGRYEEAYRSTASQFQAQTSLEGFRATVQRFGLDKYESASWDSREISGGRATLAGTVKTRGGSVATTVTLVEVGDAWKVYSLNLRAAGVTEQEPEARRPSLPDTATVRRLTQRSLLDFNDAVQRADFTAFHAAAARAFREQHSPARLKTVFKAFIDGKADIAGIKDVDPVFTKGPALSQGGTLEAAGHYPTRPSQVRFELSYVMEDGAWRLIGINVRVAPAQ